MEEPLVGLKAFSGSTWEELGGTQSSPADFSSARSILRRRLGTAQLLPGGDLIGYKKGPKGLLKARHPVVPCILTGRRASSPSHPARQNFFDFWLFAARWVAYIMQPNKKRVALGAASGDQPQRYISLGNISLVWSNLERLFTLEAAVGGLELRNP